MIALVLNFPALPSGSRILIINNAQPLKGQHIVIDIYDICLIRDHLAEAAGCYYFDILKS